MPAHALRVVSYLIWSLFVVLVAGQPAARATAMAPSKVLGATAPGGVLGAHAAPNIENLQGKVYVALGDSISAGRYATSQDDIFPSIVAERLGMNVDLVARSGATAAWALPQLGGIENAHPALVTVELGTNDVGVKTPFSVFASQYEAIVGALTRPQTRVLCIGSWLPSTSIDAIIADTCARHDGTFVSLDGFYAVNDFHARDGGSSYLGRADWFHPGDQGHAAIAAAILAALGAGPQPAVAPLTPAPRIPDVIRTHPQ